MFMNKKVLTLCAGFLLAGGLVNFASAEDVTIGDLSQKVGYLAGNGDYFFFVNSDKAYGFEEQNDGSIVEKSTPLDWNIDEEAVDNYLWKVDSVALDGETQKVWAYSLVNKATGKQLIFKKGTENQIGWVNLAADAKVTGPYDKAGYFLFHDKGTYNATVAAGTTTAIYDGQQNDGSNNWKAMHLGDGSKNINGLYRTATASSSITTDYAFYFCKYVDQEMGDNLNDLYNSIGFNFVLESKYKDVENVFAKEGERIRAVKVDNDNVKSSNSDAKFPQGVYFVVNSKEATPDTDAELYDFLMNSTLIVASPTVNDINDADWIKAGEGFQLTKKQGRDLVKVGNDKELKDDDVSVYNACFKVQKDVNGKFALTLPEFWYNATKDAEKQSKKAVSINVVDKDGDDNDDVYLTTDTDGWNYIFSYNEVNTVPYTTFLKQNAEAVYNITFADGDLAGKYLYTPAYEKAAYAKGAKFVDPETPEAQYLVTDVDLKDNNITFENRANKDYSFTAKFYEEADGVYSIAIKGGAKKTMITDLNVNTAGDIVGAAAPDVDLHTQWVKLTPVAVDKFAGAWDVDNLTEVTLSFARDDRSTSNRLFVTVSDQYGNITVSDEQTDAIQFRLRKDKDPKYITNEYAYLDAKSEVKKYADGDTIAYYTYQLEAYRDGEAINKYLAWETIYNNRYYLADKGNDFIIKDNAADGSITILYADGTDPYGYTKNIVVEDYDEVKLSISDFDGNNIEEDALTEAINAKNVKTFLKVETPETTLDPKSTYVTMSTELDNYVAIKDDRDGIITGKETTLRLFATDTDRQVPSFLIATGYDNATGERLFLFNAVDSVDYNVATGDFNKEYALNGNHELYKAIFRPGTLNEENTANDTIYTSIKGKVTAVTNKADNNKNAQAGLNRYKFQIIEDIDNEGYYLVRQEGYYLFNVNEFLVFANSVQYNRTNALRVKVEATDIPTANESINAAVSVVATDGAVIVKGAEGKNVIVSTILGKVVANEVLNSDNETIAAPAGIVVVSVDGESFKVAVK